MGQLGLWLALLLAVAVTAKEACVLSNPFLSVSVFSDAVKGEVYVQSFAVNDGKGSYFNLLHSPDNAELTSGTGILRKGAQSWTVPQFTSSSTVDCHTGSYVLLSALRSSAVLESWNISLSDRTLSWTIQRQYLQAIDVVSDRTPALVFCTNGGSNPLAACQIPGLLDLRLQLQNSTNSGYPLVDSAFELVSDQLSQTLRFSPRAFGFNSNMKAGWFSFAKQTSDGTASWVAVGATSVDRTAGIAHHDAGDLTTQIWTLQLLDTAPPLSMLQLNIASDPAATAQALSFANAHNTFMGWLYGNNPASVPCLHEMSWWTQQQGVFAASQNSATNALEAELLWMANTAVDAKGFVMPRWNVGGYYLVRWGPLHDQIPHFILAAYYHVVNTGRRAVLQQLMPALDSVFAYMQSVTGPDGVLRVPGSSGLNDGGYHATNWYDIVEFGNADAIVNAYAVRATQAMAELKQFAGDAAGAAECDRLHARAVDGFNAQFWSAQQGLYADWVDVRGNKRYWFYVEQQVLAIVHGLANSSQTQQILANLDSAYQQLCQQFGLQRDDIWSTPSNMRNVSDPGDLISNGTVPQYPFPKYENGGAFFHLLGFEMMARAVGGQPEVVQELFDRVMARGIVPTRLWGAGIDWRHQELYSEPLNNGLLVLYGYARAAFGLSVTLKDGIQVIGKPPKALEGSFYVFPYLGHDYKASVTNGQTTVTPL